MLRRRYALITTSGLLLALLMLLSLSLPASTTLAQSFGSNWIGQFYNTTDLSGNLVATASFPNGLNVNWGTLAPTDGVGQPIPGVNPDGWSARFATTVTITPGSYDFVVVADDGARLQVNGQTVIDQFADTGFDTYTVTLAIQANTVQLVVDYVDVTDAAVLQVFWSPAGTPQPTGTVAPVAIGQVQTVAGLALRTGPYLGASLVAVARPQNNYNILARNESEGLFTWYKIQYNENTIGWVSGRYFAITEGDINNVPFEDTVFDQLATNLPPNRGIIGATRAIMNFRVRPSERVARNAFVPQIPWGDEVEILGRTVQGGQSFWLFVAYNPPDEDTTPTQYGWIYAPFITIRGPIEAVQVY